MLWEGFIGVDLAFVHIGHALLLGKVRLFIFALHITDVSA